MCEGRITESPCCHLEYVTSRIHTTNHSNMPVMWILCVQGCVATGVLYRCKITRRNIVRILFSIFSLIVLYTYMFASSYPTMKRTNDESRYIYSSGNTYFLQRLYSYMYIYTMILLYNLSSLIIKHRLFSVFTLSAANSLITLLRSMTPH